MTYKFRLVSLHLSIRPHPYNISLYVMSFGYAYTYIYTYHITICDTNDATEKTQLKRT